MLLVGQEFDPAGGPSILSRGGRIGTRGTELGALTFSAGVDGIYDTSMGGLVLSPDGTLQQVSGAGVEARATLFGTHRWRRSSLGINYLGSYSEYTGNDYLNGTTQTLGLDFSKQHSKKLRTNLKLATGTSNRPYGAIAGFNGYGAAGALDALDPNFIAVPVQELFNNRVNYVQGSVGFVYQQSSRLSFGLTASGYGVRRAAKGLGGTNGYLGGAEASYRVSKRSSVSVDYSFAHMEYPGSFGASDVHGLGIAYGRSVGRDWDFNLGVRINRVESLGLARVELDPVVAALLGQSSGVEAFYSLVALPGFSARVSRRFRRGSLDFVGSKSISPGNGLLLTSQATGFSGGYSYNGIRHWSLYGSAGYMGMSTLTRSSGKYSSFNAGFGVSRDIFRTIHVTSRWDFRDQLISVTNFGRTGSRVSVGLAWSSRRVPLAIW